jgi:hypothetical protein
MTRLVGWMVLLVMVSSAGAADPPSVPSPVTGTHTPASSDAGDIPEAGEEPLLQINHWPPRCRSVRLRRNKSGCLDVRWRPEGCQLDDAD